MREEKLFFQSASQKLFSFALISRHELKKNLFLELFNPSLTLLGQYIQLRFTTDCRLECLIDWLIRKSFCGNLVFMSESILINFNEFWLACKSRKKCLKINQTLEMIENDWKPLFAPIRKFEIFQFSAFILVQKKPKQKHVIFENLGFWSETNRFIGKHVKPDA